MPSGNGMATLVLSRLAELAVEPRYLELAQGALGPMQEMLARYPLGFAQWLIALDMFSRTRGSYPSSATWRQPTPGLARRVCHRLSPSSDKRGLDLVAPVGHPLL